jgi:hypothetical protein
MKLLEMFMAMKIHISVFWLIMPCLKAYHEVPKHTAGYENGK